MKVAFVIPWFGLDIAGGAEAECLNTASHLHKAGVPVEVLTTCIKEFRSDWSVNYHPQGTETLRGIPVRRFPVAPRDTDAFNQINARLMNGMPITAEEETVFAAGRRRTARQSRRVPSEYATAFAMAAAESPKGVTRISRMATDPCRLTRSTSIG